MKEKKHSSSEEKVSCDDVLLTVFSVSSGVYSYFVVHFCGPLNTHSIHSVFVLMKG